MEGKKRKYSIDEKEKLGQLCATFKEQYENLLTESKSSYDSKKRKYANSTSASGYLSKAVREMYPPMKDMSSEDPKFKSAVQLARRSYNSYIKKQND